MTDTTNTADTTQAPDTAQVPPTPAAMPPTVPAEPDSDDTRALDESGWHPEAISEIRKLRREAQHLRERSRTAEGDKERLITQIGALHHREVERIAAEHLVDPSDVWRAGTTDFTDPETGELNPALVVEAAQSLAADKPHLARPSSSPPPSDRPVERLRAGATPADYESPKPSWQSVIPRPHRRLG